MKNPLIVLTFCFALFLCGLPECIRGESRVKEYDWETVKSGLPEYVVREIDRENAVSLTEEEKHYLAFLYRSMPLPDMTGYPFGYWLANVRKALEVRRNAVWEIPERIQAFCPTGKGK